MHKYNNIEHTTIKMSPNEARKEGNKLMVSYIIWDKATRDRKYPELKVWDDVGVMLRKYNTTKGTDPKWSEKVFPVAPARVNTIIFNDKSMHRRMHL